MASPSGIRAGAAYVELFVKDNRLTKGLDAAGKKLKAFGAGILSVGARLTTIGAGMAAPFLAAAKVFADVGSDLVDMSQRTGVSVEALSELGFAAEQSGADLATLETGLRKMQKSVVEAASGSEAAKMALKQLGLTVDDLAHLSPDEQFKLMADRLNGIENPAVRTAAAMELFGKSGTKLLPLMSGGAKGIEELQKKARDLGLTISTEDATAAEEFGDKLATLWTMLKRAAFAVGAALVPVLSDLAGVVVRVVKTTTDWVKRNQTLIVGAFKVAAVILGVGVAVTVLGAAIYGVGAVFGAMASVLTGVGTAIGVIGSLLAALFSPIGLVIAGVASFAAYILYATGVGAKALDWLGGVFTDLKNDALAAFGGISNALAAGDIGLAAKILWLTLKMEWQKGVNWLNEKWIGFKEFFLSIWTEAVFGFSRLLTNSWAGLQSAWTEVVSGLLSAWTVFSSGAMLAWRGAQNFIAKGIVHLMSLLDDSIDVDATVKTLDDDFNREQQQRQKATQDQLAQVEADRQRRNQEIEQQRSGTVTELERDREGAHAGRKKQFHADLAESDQALANARAEWQAALDEAAKKREESDRQGPPSVRRPKEQLEGLDEVVSESKAKIDVQGSFNAAAIRGFGSDSVSERTAKASEQTAANTKRLLQQAQHGGLAFG